MCNGMTQKKMTKEKNGDLEVLPSRAAAIYRKKERNQYPMLAEV